MARQDTIGRVCEQLREAERVIAAYERHLRDEGNEQQAEALRRKNRKLCETRKWALASPEAQTFDSSAQRAIAPEHQRDTGQLVPLIRCVPHRPDPAVASWTMHVAMKTPLASTKLPDGTELDACTGLNGQLIVSAKREGLPMRWYVVDLYDVMRGIAADLEAHPIEPGEDRP